MPKKDTYQCAICGKTFEYNWTDEEAEEELKINFGPNMKKEECDLVCDDCYQRIFFN